MSISEQDASRSSEIAGSDEFVSIEMPRLSSDGEGEGEGATLVSWLVAVGDEVERGEVIAELETEKATVELESPATGRISELSVTAGTEDLRSGIVLGTIGLTSAAPASESERFEPSDGPRPTPLARRAAADKAIDLDALSGSGPGGRVVEADVLRVAGATAEPDSSPRAEEGAIPEAAAAPLEASLESEDEFRVERLSAMRKTIARRMTESKQQVPHFYLRMRISMDEVIGVRSGLNADVVGDEHRVKLSVNDFVVRAAALAMRDVPAANVQYAEEGMRVFERVDVSVAVATEGGLVTPVVRDADRKGLMALSAEIQALAREAREGRLRPEQYRGGTVTISNLGMYGIETVYPILNPPQACIFGVGAADEQPIVRDGEITVGRVATITLAADHRAVDGAVGAQLLAALRTRLEDPLSMIL